MKSSELRERFLAFFEKNGHKIVPSSSLLPTDPSVLFTTAGMQQFKPYYLGELSPFGKNVTSCQKCIRTSDIEEVGDERHLTFFEMLGNFSFGGYFKEDAINLAKKFLDELEIKIDYVTVFEGDENTPRDEDSARIWGKLGFSEDKGNLRFENKNENFWGPTGEEGPCGPTTEIYSGGIEIWNIVFNQYYSKDGKLEPLKTPGIDTGMGLERLAMVMQKKPTVFETDLFEPITKKIEELSSLKYSGNEKLYRIIADHIKASVFLLSEEITPSNLGQGYILRRLIRRQIRCSHSLTMKNDYKQLVEAVDNMYGDIYPLIKNKKDLIIEELEKEYSKFIFTLTKGLKILSQEITAQGVGPRGELGKIHNLEIIDDFPNFTPARITGRWLFDFYQTFGFPPELALEEIERKLNRTLDPSDIKRIMNEFQEEARQHQDLSRTASAGMFKGGLADASLETTKLHTAAHLMLAGLRKVLGDDVYQKGSNITAERLRFDFSHKEKMTSGQLKDVENFVNDIIKKDLPVTCKEMTLDEAKEIGAMGVFESKYGEKVKVYIIGEGDDIASKEICGGPHVERAGILGHFKIQKEESSSSGVRRIKAILE